MWTADDSYKDIMYNTYISKHIKHANYVDEYAPVRDVRRDSSQTTIVIITICVIV